MGRGSNRDRAYPESYGQQPQDHGAAGGSNRRYTLSAAPPGERGVSPSMPQGGQDAPRPQDGTNQQDQQPQSQQVPIQGGGGGAMGMGGNDMMGNLSQRSAGPFHRGSMAMGASPHGGMPVYGAELSPTHFAHRMSLGFYPMSGGSANSPAFNDPMGDLSGRGGGGPLPPPGGGPPGPSGQHPPGSQAEREEELLLNLLIARRQRGRMAGDDPKTASLTDELMRLRQGRAAAQRQGAPGNLPQMPGIPPLYADAMTGAPGVPSNMYPAEAFRGQHGGDPMKADYPPFPHHMHRHMQDMSERINRSPGRFQMFDARMGGPDMRDYSERGMAGFKRSMGMAMHPGMGMMYEAPGYHMGMEPQQPPMDHQPPTKKKRTHKKKPADMPRRPLSAYNLFFSEERERILKEIEKKEKKEEGKDVDGDAEEEENKKNQERPKALLRPLIPSQKKRRPHRKTHGKISFQQLARMVGERWKSLPEDDRKYYQGLAQEDMKRQKIAMEEYYAKQNGTKKSEGVSTAESINAEAVSNTAKVDPAAQPATV